MSIEPAGLPLGGPAYLVKLGELIGHPFISINGAAIEPEQPEPEAET